MARKVRLINGKGDWEATPPTGASDADLYQLANDFVEQGGVINKTGGDGEVTELDTPGMSVKVKKGTIYVENSSWVPNSFEPRFYQVVADADEEIAISTNSSGSTRVDLVCQSVDKITEPNDDGSNVTPLVIVEGDPGEGTPDLPNDHELLAVLTLPDGTTAAVTDDMIDTDVRRQVFLNPGAINAGFVIAADGATITLDLQDGKRDKFFTTPTANRSIAFANAPVGKYFSLYVEQGSGGNKAYTFADSILWTENTVPDRATTAGAIDVYVFVKLPSGEYSGVLASGNQQ